MKVQNDAELSLIYSYGDFVGNKMVWWWGGQVPISSLTVACVEGKWEGGKTKGKIKERGKTTPLPFSLPSFAPFDACQATYI